MATEKAKTEREKNDYSKLLQKMRRQAPIKLIDNANVKLIFRYTATYFIINILNCYFFNIISLV